MFYREAGQFKTSYDADSQIFPIRQDRIGVHQLFPLLVHACHFGGVSTTLGRLKIT